MGKAMLEGIVKSVRWLYAPSSLGTGRSPGNVVSVRRGRRVNVGVLGGDCLDKDTLSEGCTRLATTCNNVQNLFELQTGYTYEPFVQYDFHLAASPSRSDV